MTTINEKIKRKIYCDSDFAISLYESLDMTAIDYFYDEKILDDNMRIECGENMIFLLAQCQNDHLVKHIFSKEENKIIAFLNNFPHTDVINKLCYFLSCQKIIQIDSFFEIVTKWMKTINESDHAKIKNHIIKTFINVSEKDLITPLIKKGLFTIDNLSDYSMDNTLENDVIAQIKAHQMKPQILLNESIKMLKETFDVANEAEQYGENIIIKNQIAALKTYLNYSDVVLNIKDIKYLFKIADSLDDSQLQALTNRIFLNNRKIVVKNQQNYKKRI